MPIIFGRRDKLAKVESTLESLERKVNETLQTLGQVTYTLEKQQYELAKLTGVERRGSNSDITKIEKEIASLKGILLGRCMSNYKLFKKEFEFIFFPGNNFLSYRVAQVAFQRGSWNRVVRRSPKVTTRARLRTPAQSATAQVVQSWSKPSRRMHLGTQLENRSTRIKLHRFVMWSLCARVFCCLSSCSQFPSYFSLLSIFDSFPLAHGNLLTLVIICYHYVF